MPLDELIGVEEWAVIDGRYTRPEASPFVRPPSARRAASDERTTGGAGAAIC